MTLNNTLLIVITSLISGLVATIINLFVQKGSENKKIKISIFEVLMSHRYLIHDKENVEALNKVEVVFHKDDEVRKAWTEFLDAADAASKNSSSFGAIDDKYLKLLEKIAQNIGYKDIDWANIKRFYFPQGLSTKITEEDLLRKAQLSQVTAILNQDTSTSQLSREEFGMKFLLKAMESPDGLEKVTRIAELAQNGKKGGKR